ncbi:agamous-like mads-box protein agl92 [Phtheirospermum japonicum]|uniref:Agamous-like mads-box protein agl92 n=1 Tax=Phtheirospermum japonicum TaxID=374723 RepID=A0A830CA90_9LAMI|nr:agamous-like mads-box protein agl92 [Phtheirospermum japonicum]
MWPSPEIFRERLQKFMDFPNTERTRKMVTHEKFLEQIIATEIDTLVKSKAKVQLKESEQLLNQLTRGKRVDEFDLHQLKCLSSFSAQMLEKLDKREAELNNEQQQGQPPLPHSTLEIGARGQEALSPTTLLIENLMNDQWFIDSMSEEQNIGVPPAN